MKRFINKIKTSIWLYPLLYSVAAFLLSTGITILERNYAVAMSYYISDIFYTTSELARSVLGIVAGAFITIATFTFSTTMVVLTMYSSQFTPRVVENFLNNKVTMKSFGVFLSGFIFAITSLLFTRNSEEGNLVIAASVSVIYVIVGLVYFLRFINSVATHIQASDLILRLQEEAMNKINEYCLFLETSKVISESEMLEMIQNKRSTEIYGHSDGYIQEIDRHKLQKIAQNSDVVICFKKVVGQFISTETRIFTIYHDEPVESEEEIKKDINGCVLIGNKRTQTQDFSFTIHKIVEIAVKALSPGINDPNTATHCLKILGVLLRDLAHIEKGYIVLKEEDEQGYAVFEAHDFEELLYDTYNQIFFYGQSDTAVLIAGFKSLRFVKAKASQNNVTTIDRFAKNLFERNANMSKDTLEYKRIEKEYRDVMEI